MATTYEANQGFYNVLRYGVTVAPGPGRPPSPCDYRLGRCGRK